ncbi:MAG: hypothetical protein K6G00_07080 [Treponema sp.]|nr:hypothetical protein [Treponema sp.]
MKIKVFLLIITAILSGLYFSCSKKTAEQASPSQEGIKSGLNDGSPSESNVSALEQEVPPSKAKAADASEKAFSIKDVDVSQLMVRPSVFVAEKNNLDPQHLVYDNASLYFIGFSESGHLAFMEFQVLEGKGSPESAFYIQDLVSDEIVLALKGSDNSGDGCDLDSLIEEYHEEIDAALVMYGIEAVPCQFKALPYDDGGSFIDIQVNVTDTGRLMYDMLKIINYECVASDGRKGSKTICLKKEVTVEDVYACGYIKSPLEDRLAVVIAEKVYGFEGCDLHYSVVGCRID